MQNKSRSQSSADAAAKMAKTPALNPDEAAGRAKTPGKSKKSDEAAGQAKTPGIPNFFGKADDAAVKAKTPAPLGSRDPNIVAGERPSKRARVSTQQYADTELDDEFFDGIGDEDLLSLEQSAGSSGSDIDSEVQVAFDSLNLVNGDDDDDRSDCSDFGDLEQDDDLDLPDGVFVAEPDSQAENEDSTEPWETPDGLTEPTKQMHSLAVELLCKKFPASADELKAFFDDPIERDPAIFQAHKQRFKDFKKKEVKLSGMPEIDIPSPTGISDLAKVGWQLNHPTYDCTSMPGETLDKACRTTLALLNKGVEDIHSFTYDTVNRRANPRKVASGGVLKRTRMTEPKTWAQEVQDAHHDYIKWIWENLPFKVVLLFGGENHDLFKKMMKLSPRRVRLDTQNDVDAAIWRCKNGKIGKIVLFLWHPEYVNRSRRLVIGKAYDAQINFACDLSLLAIKRDYFESRCKSAKPSAAEQQTIQVAFEKSKAQPQAVKSPVTVTQARQPTPIPEPKPKAQGQKNVKFAPIFKNLASKPTTPKPAELAKVSSPTKSPDRLDEIQKLTTYEALKQEMSGEILPITLLPTTLLRWLKESTDSRKKFVSKVKAGQSPIDALQSLVDPKGQAKSTFLAKSSARFVERRGLLSTVFKLVTRGPNEAEPSSVELICEICERSAWVDKHPRFMESTGAYILPEHKARCQKCRSKPRRVVKDDIVHSVNENKIRFRINRVLQQNPLLRQNNAQNAAVIAENVLSIRNRLTPLDRGAENLVVKQDFYRGPEGNDPAQVLTVCPTCNEFKFLDKKPQYEISSGRYICNDRICQTEECQKACKGRRIFGPCTDESTPSDQKFTGQTISTHLVEKQVKAINLEKRGQKLDENPAAFKSTGPKLAAKLQDEVMADDDDADSTSNPPQNASVPKPATVDDVYAQCHRKPEVKSLMTVCKDCKKTEKLDSDPRFYGDLYVAQEKQGKFCACLPKKSTRTFIPKEVKGAKTWGWIARTTLKSRITRERRDAAGTRTKRPSRWSKHRD